MTVIEMKEKLIAKIGNINDEELLERLSDVIEFEHHNGPVHEMNPGEIEAVNEGLDQLKNGQWISGKESNNRADEWLKKHGGR